MTVAEISQILETEYYLVPKGVKRIAAQSCLQLNLDLSEPSDRAIADTLNWRLSQSGLLLDLDAFSLGIYCDSSIDDSKGLGAFLQSRHFDVIEAPRTQSIDIDLDLTGQLVSLKFDLGQCAGTSCSLSLDDLALVSQDYPTVPCTIKLGVEQLTTSEQICAEAIRDYLSERCNRKVHSCELEGLLLNLWSEHELSDRPLSDFLESDRPLQFLLMADRQTSNQVSPFSEYIGQRFEFRLGVCHQI